MIRFQNPIPSWQKGTSPNFVCFCVCGHYQAKLLLAHLIGVGTSVLENNLIFALRYSEQKTVKVIPSMSSEVSSGITGANSYLGDLRGDGVASVIFEAINTSSLMFSTIYTGEYAFHPKRKKYLVFKLEKRLFVGTVACIRECYRSHRQHFFAILCDILYILIQSVQLQVRFKTLECRLPLLQQQDELSEKLLGQVNEQGDSERFLTSHST